MKVFLTVALLFFAGGSFAQSYSHGLVSNGEGTKYSGEYFFIGSTSGHVYLSTSISVNAILTDAIATFSGPNQYYQADAINGTLYMGRLYLDVDGPINGIGDAYVELLATASPGYYASAGAGVFW